MSLLIAFMALILGLMFLTRGADYFIDNSASFAQEKGIIGLTDINSLRRKNVLQGGTLNDTRFGNNLSFIELLQAICMIVGKVSLED